MGAALDMANSDLSLMVRCRAGQKTQKGLGFNQMPKDMPFAAQKDQMRLINVGHASCRWIISREGFGDYLVCGRRARIGSSYCTEHHGRVWRPSQDSRRSHS